MMIERDDLRARGEPLAVLWASEAAIYGRFGYGMAAPHYEMDADRSRFSFRDDPGPRGKVRMLALEDAVEPCMQIYERVRSATPGFTARAREWWEAYRLADPEEWRRGASPKYVALIELDDEPAAYAIYRIKSEWQDGFPKGTVRVVEALAAKPAAERELWRFVFGIDLTVRVESRVDPVSPLFLMVLDARSLNLSCKRGPLAADRRPRERACRPFVCDGGRRRYRRAGQLLSVECRTMARRPGNGAHGR